MTAAPHPKEPPMPTDADRARLVATGVRAMFDCYRGYNEETQRMMFAMAERGLRAQLERLLTAWADAGLAVVPCEVNPAILAHGWQALNAGRTRQVGMGPGPGLSEAWPAMVRAADLARPTDRGGYDV